MEESIALMFDKCALTKGRLRLFFYDDAVKIINECKSRRVKLLGIDSFKISARGIQPFMEYSYDYSDLDINETWDKAYHDISRLKDSEFVFEIVF